MKNAIFSDLHPFSKMLFLFFTILVSFLVVVTAGSLIAIPLYGINVFKTPELLDVSEHPEFLGASKYFQVVQSLGIFVIPPFIAAFIFSRNASSYLKINTRIPWFLFLIAGIIIFASLPIIEWMLRINGRLVMPESFSGIEKWMKAAEENRKEITEAYLAVDSFTEFLINLVIIGFIAAIGEELLFRGVLQRLFGEWFRNQHWAIFVTAFLFSALHMQFYGFLPRFTLGLLLGYLFIWSGSLWVPIFAHFVNNASAVIVYYLANNGKLNVDPEEFGNVDNNLIFLASVCMVVSLIIVAYLKRIHVMNDNDVELTQS